MSVADDLREILDKMPQAFVPEKAGDLDATIQLNLTGEGGGQWIVQIANCQIDLSEGETESVDLTLSMEASDYVALSMGEANPVNLFMTGKIKVQGNAMLALKFQDLFDRDRVSE
jgi:putative sterol carrier protein